VTDPRQALDRLRSAAKTGELGAVCRRYGVALLVAFGSAVRRGTAPRDLDLAVRFSGDTPDMLSFLDELTSLAGTSQLDLMDLGRAGPVAREQALVGGEPLVEEAPDLFDRAQLAAIMERMDTAWLRRIDLELMAR
jgi:predicted nucleotidyltransferase